MDYLKVVENKFYHFDMDEVLGENSGGLPSGTLRDLPASEYAAKLMDPEELEKNPVPLTAQLFQLNTEEVDTRCHAVTARMVLKNNAPQIEFQAAINEGEDPLRPAAVRAQVLPPHPPRRQNRIAGKLHAVPRQGAAAAQRVPPARRHLQQAPRERSQGAGLHR